AVLRLHQRHAELVEPVALAALLRVEDRRAGHVLVGFVQGHQRFSSGQYNRIGLSTSSFFCSSGVVAMCGMKSTSSPSSGMWSFRFGCGQSVPHSTRSGNVSTTLRANGCTSRYAARSPFSARGPLTDSLSGQLTLLHTLGCSRMNLRNSANSGPSSGLVTSGRLMWSTT